MALRNTTDSSTRKTIHSGEGSFLLYIRKIWLCYHALSLPVLVARTREFQPVHQMCWIFASAHSCLHLCSWPSSDGQAGSHTPSPPRASNKRYLWKGDMQRRRWASPFSLGCTQYAVSCLLGIRAERSNNLPMWPEPIQLTWTALYRHFASVLRQWHRMLLSCVIWTVSTFFLWSWI